MENGTITKSYTVKARRISLYIDCITCCKSTVLFRLSKVKSNEEVAGHAEIDEAVIYVLSKYKCSKQIGLLTVHLPNTLL